MINDIYIRLVLLIVNRRMSIIIFLLGCEWLLVQDSIVYAEVNSERLEELKARLNCWRYVNNEEDLLWTGSPFLLREGVSMPTEEVLTGAPGILLEIAGPAMDLQKLEEVKRNFPMWRTYYPEGTYPYPTKDFVWSKESMEYLINESNANIRMGSLETLETLLSSNDFVMCKPIAEVVSFIERSIVRDASEISEVCLNLVKGLAPLN